MALGAAPAAKAAQYTADKAVKIDVMGEWAHPDDDTSIIGPCGVWHQRYGVKCGIIMVTRGEGGGNAAGTEGGPALGLRRENEDRIAHFRSGTVDIFNLDRIDFFYNQSAPLTQYFWDEQETLRRVTRVIRETQPEIYIGFTPTLAAGHGNHQQAGRLIWEGVLAAADPNMFPEQLTGPGALSTWQVKKVFSGGSTAGTGGTTTPADCTPGFVPPATHLSTLAGGGTGYPSPSPPPARDPQGQPPRAAKTGAPGAAAGSVRLNVPSGWTVSDPRSIGPISSASESTATFTVTPSSSATAGQYKISAQLTDGKMTGYTDNVMQVVPPVEGRFQRWGKFAE